MNTYLVLGMKRSGHHAIIEWIARNLEGGTTHFNDCSKGWRQGLLIPSNMQNEKGKTIITGKGENIVYNIEDFHPQQFETYKMGSTLKIFEHDVQVLLVLRDPFNWIASCLKCGGGPKKFINRRIQIWKAQAKEFLGETNFIKLPPNRPKLKFVNFNSWFLDLNYKAHIANLIHLDSHDKGYDVVSPRGGGSSFDAMKFKNKASQMKVLERYLEFAHNQEYLKLIDDEIINLGSRIFD